MKLQEAMDFAKSLKNKTVSELASIAATLKRSYGIRKKSLESRGVNSRAVNTVEKKETLESPTEYAKKGKNIKDIKKKLADDIRTYQNFFNSKTSEIPPNSTKKENKTKSKSPSKSPSKSKTAASTKTKQSNQSTESANKFDYPKAPRNTEYQKKARKLAQTDFAEFGKTKANAEGISKLESILSVLQRAAKETISQYESDKYKDVYSPAIESIKSHNNAYFGNPTDLRNGRSDFQYRNKLLAEIAVFHSFFNDKTASIAGAIKFNKEQDAIMVGKTGVHFTKKQKDLYWKIYNEFMRQHPEKLYDSKQTQRVISTLYFDSGKLDSVDWSDLDVVQILEEINTELNTQLEAEYEAEEELFQANRTFYSGNWI